MAPSWSQFRSECGHQATFIKQFHQQGRLRWQHQSFSIDLILWLIPVGFLIQIIQKLIKQKKAAVRDSIGDLLIMGLVIYAHFF